ncbi:MAG: UDP-N-acetylmuramoyl-tripeptide--D-alanyl-D-alanine ligase, partial [Actinomycetes bacterium]
MTLAQIAARTGGHLVGGDPESLVDGFDYDSRVQRAGAGFVALIGDRDGHDFVADALVRGAAGALVARVPDGVTGPFVVVEDPLTALGTLARSARADLGATVLAVIGSAGKTSTKDLLAGALAADRSVHATASSHNNEFGLPVTILDAPLGTQALVLELGERNPGDLAYLAGIAAPQVAVATNVGLAHAEHLGGPDGVEGTMVEVLGALPADGLAVLNADCPSTPRLRPRASAPVVTAGYAADATVRILAATVGEDLCGRFDLATPWGAVGDIRLAVHGRHQIVNAALAATAALHLGVTPDAVRRGLGSVSGARWRMELARSSSGVTVLNDSYNASPAAVEAALRSLADLPATRRVAVLGSMLELG